MRKILKQVTVTGADDSVDPQDLVQIYNKYPFVEFGILCSKNNTGMSRFPSEDWLCKLRNTFRYPMSFSMHICGTWVNDICERNGSLFKNDWIYYYSDLFDRIQMNYRGLTTMPTQKVKDICNQFHRQIIFPISSIYPVLFDGDYFNDDTPIVDLYDSSGGRGITAEQWLKPVGNYCGYSGGLSPDNLKENLDKLCDIVGDTPIWIDAETHLRSNNDRQFDLDKVVKFLEIAKPYVK